MFMIFILTDLVADTFSALPLNLSYFILRKCPRAGAARWGCSGSCYCESDTRPLPAFWPKTKWRSDQLLHNRKYSADDTSRKPTVPSFLRNRSCFWTENCFQQGYWPTIPETSPPYSLDICIFWIVYERRKISARSVIACASYLVWFEEGRKKPEFSPERSTPVRPTLLCRSPSNSLKRRAADIW